MNKQQLEEILNDAPKGMPQVHISEQFGVVYITVGGDDHNLSDLQTQLNQLNEIERLGAVLSDMVRTSEGGLGHFYSIDEFYKARADADQLLKELNK